MGDSAEKQTKPGLIGRIKAGCKGVKSEYKKISWPDKQSTLKQSIAVVVISVVLGLIIAVLDYVLQYGVNFLTSL